MQTQFKPAKREDTEKTQIYTLPLGSCLMEQNPNFLLTRNTRTQKDLMSRKTEQLYLAVPAPVPGIPLVLALVLGSLGSLQCPRCDCGAGGGPGDWGLVVVFGPSRRRGGGLAAPRPLLLVQALPGLVLPRGRL